MSADFVAVGRKLVEIIPTHERHSRRRRRIPIVAASDLSGNCEEGRLQPRRWSLAPRSP